MTRLIVGLAQAQEPADAGIRLERRVAAEPEYHQKYTNIVVIQGGRRLVFQPPAGWFVRLLAADQKVLCQPVGAGQWLSLQIVATNALVTKPEIVPLALNATNSPVATNAPAPSNASLVKPETLEGWYKTTIPSAKITETHAIRVNGLDALAATLQYSDNGALRFYQAACVDLFTNFVLVTHAIPGTNNGSVYLNGVLNSLSLETNAPAR